MKTQSNRQTMQPAIRDISQALTSLPDSITVAELNAVLEGGAKIFVQEAKSIAKSHLLDNTHTDMVNSIGIIRKRGGQKAPFLMVGPRYYAGGQAAHLVEFGTVERMRTFGNSSGITNKRLKAKLLGKASTGVMPARPFMRPAWDQNKQRVANLVRKEIAELVMSKARAKGFTTTNKAA